MLTYDWKIEANGRTFKDKIRGCIEVTQRLKWMTPFTGTKTQFPTLTLWVTPSITLGDLVIIYDLCGYQTGLWYIGKIQTKCTNIHTKIEINKPLKYWKRSNKTSYTEEMFDLES